MSEQRVGELDGLRAIAVSMVVLWHYIGLPAARSGPHLDWLFHLLILGRTGVDLFFVLSGFLITRILIQQRESSNYFAVFYTRRILRILPPYLLLLSAMAAARWFKVSAWLFEGSVPIWPYAVFMQNYWMRLDLGAIWMAATWSLAVEEQFYLFFPLIVWLVPVRMLPVVLGAALIVGPVARGHAYAPNDLAYYVRTHCRIDSLAIGGVVAWATLNFPYELMQYRALFSRSFFGLLLGLVPLGIGLAREPDWHMAYWGHTYLNVLFAGALLSTVLNAASPSGSLLAFLRARLLSQLAAVSYSLYLIHVPVLYSIFSAFDKTQALDPVGLLLISFSLVFSLLICKVLYAFVEQPCFALGHLMRYRHPRGLQPELGCDK